MKTFLWVSVLLFLYSLFDEASSKAAYETWSILNPGVTIPWEQWRHLSRNNALPAYFITPATSEKLP